MSDLWPLWLILFVLLIMDDAEAMMTPLPLNNPTASVPKDIVAEEGKCPSKPLSVTERKVYQKDVGYDVIIEVCTDGTAYWRLK